MRNWTSCSAYRSLLLLLLLAFQDGFGCVLLRGFVGHSKQFLLDLVQSLLLFRRQSFGVDRGDRA